MCLDSPGGDLNEGLKIAKYVSEYFTSTVVGSGSRCESACAVIFLSSESPSLHVNGAIGLHAPKLILPEGNFTEKEVEKAYDLAVYTTREIMKIRTFPAAALRYMVSTPASKMYIPKTFLEIDELGISLRGDFSLRQLPLEKLMEHVCLWKERGAEAMYMAERYEKGTNRGLLENIRFIGFTVASSNFANLKIGAEYSVRGEEDHWGSCEVEMDFTDPFGRGPELDFYSVKRNGIHTAQFSIYPSDASYIEIYQLPKHTEVTLFKEIKSIEDQFFKKENKQKIACAIFEYDARVVNVQTFTNLRQQPGLSGRKIAEVDLNETVRVVKPNHILRTERCGSICQGRNPESIRQCIDNNEVWIEVEYNGLRGFLSRKFLE